MKITRPTLLLDKEKCLKNIEIMTTKAAKNKLIFRPHFKTHQSKEIGNWFRDFGVEKITVSSVQMAQYFADAGWKDITIAFPFNQLEIDEINDLAARIKLNILIIHADSVKFLKKHLKDEVGIFIKIDCGYHRTGIAAEDYDEIYSVISMVNSVKKLKLKGLLTHSGHAYLANSIEQILIIHEYSKQKMILIKKQYQLRFPDLIVSVGDTSTCSLADNFSGIDEIRPGNFVFYDVMQLKMQTCNSNQIAIAAACPIVAKNIERNEIAVYGGGVHLSKEFIWNEDNSRNYGLVVELNDKGWWNPLANTHVTSLSQEHGIIRVPIEKINQFKVGNVIGILPIHSCMTSNLMGKYHTLDGKILDHI